VPKKELPLLSKFASDFRKLGIGVKRLKLLVEADKVIKMVL